MSVCKGSVRVRGLRSNNYIDIYLYYRNYSGIYRGAICMNDLDCRKYINI